MPERPPQDRLFSHFGLALDPDEPSAEATHELAAAEAAAPCAGCGFWIKRGTERCECCGRPQNPP